MRYDSTLPLTSSTSYALFDLQANVNSTAAGFWGAVFDGRYLYFVPNKLGTVVRYDTTLSFSNSTSYSQLNVGVASINSHSYGFIGGAFDGRYVYFIPNTWGVLTRIDGYPGNQSVTPSALTAPQGFVVGTYSGVFSPPLGGMLVGGFLGVSTTSPGFPVDVNGITSARRVYATATQIDAQIVQLFEGNSQGGYGGGSVGTFKTMGSPTAAFFNLGANLNSNCYGFVGGVFDGRYIYLIPNNNSADFGQIARYDTMAGTFAASTSYAIFDTAANVNSNSRGFSGGAFDGRYVYLVPNGSAGGQITQYDTTAGFGVSTSYAVFNTAISSINSHSNSFAGAVFDGRYLYFIPNATGFGVITQYDTTKSFTAAASYAAINTTANGNSNSRGFLGGTYDGRYIYLSPFNNGADFGQITRYDTSLSFTASTSYSFYDTARNVNSNSRGFFGAVFDGRYIYFVPYGTSSSQGQVTRYDTTGSFTSSTSYAIFNIAANVNLTSLCFSGGVFDGRYVYFSPYNSATSGLITRYDVTSPFTSPLGYTVLDLRANVNSNSAGFQGAIFDGRYIYFVPNSGASTILARIDAYPGRQSVAIAASQAPNGLVIGSYAGLFPAPAGNLFLGSSVVFNQTVQSAAYTLQTTDMFVGISTGSTAINLPSSAPIAGTVYIVMDQSGTAGVNAITVFGTINGTTAAVINSAYGAVRLYSNGTQWFTW